MRDSAGLKGIEDLGFRVYKSYEGCKGLRFRV